MKHGAKRQPHPAGPAKVAGPSGHSGGAGRVVLHTPATPGRSVKLELASSGWLQLAKARGFHGRRPS